MASLNDIARHLGLSPMTVSRVVNRSGPVSQATRERVLAAMVELGYRRDEYASIDAQKRGGRPRAFHVIVDAVDEAPQARRFFAFYSTITLACLMRLHRLECRTSVTDLARGMDAHLDTITSADAIICCSPVPEGTIERVRRLNPGIVPITVCQQPVPGCLAVDPDDEEGGRLAAEAAAQGGHERVAVFATPDQRSQELRATSFITHLAARSPSTRIDRITYDIDGDGITADEERMRAALARHWRTAPRPGLIFCPGGFAAFQCYRFLGSLGLAIPDDVGLIGYDDLPFYDYLATPVDRVVFDVADLAHRAIDALLPLINHQAAAPATTRILVPVSYEARGSVRRAANG